MTADHKPISYLFICFFMAFYSSKNKSLEVKRILKVPYQPIPAKEKWFEENTLFNFLLHQKYQVLTWGHWKDIIFCPGERANDLSINHFRVRQKEKFTKTKQPQKKKKMQNHTENTQLKRNIFLLWKSHVWKILHNERFSISCAHILQFNLNSRLKKHKLHVDFSL